MLFQRQILVRAIAGGVIALGLAGCSSEGGIARSAPVGSWGLSTASSSSGSTASQSGASGTSASGASSAATPAAAANMVVFVATLAPSEEVPPAANSKGQGTAEVRIDPATNEFTYTVSYSGLTGPATMGHIHGPASAGSNAGVVVPFPGVTGGADKAQGKAKLTQAQYGDLAAGLYYVNVHTAQYPGGEIRGQLKKQGG